MSGKPNQVDFRPTNANGVGRNQWNKWNLLGKQVFNKLFQTMMENQWSFVHPLDMGNPPEHWRTICWNSSWMAADIASRGANILLKDARPKRGR